MREKTAELLSESQKKSHAIRRDKQLYFFLIPGLMFILLFDLLPMLNITIAFKQFKPLLGFKGSPWVGLDHFKKLLGDYNVWNVIKNTLEINVLKIIFCVPLPMFLAILINEINSAPLKRTIQTIIYIPHFFTWVVVYSVFYIVFGSGGVINSILAPFVNEPVMFFLKGAWFRFLLVVSDAWQSSGWGTIIYLAAIMGIDSEIYDAAVVDGAGKVQQIKHITIPCLIPVMILILSIRLGRIMTSSFDQILAFYNPSVYESADIISTYVYRTGIGQANFSYATAVGLFNSLIGSILVVSSNILSRKITGRSVW
jgi:putative aldouronate transport system permease protein